LTCAYFKHDAESHGGATAVILGVALSKRN